MGEVIVHCDWQVGGLSGAVLLNCDEGTLAERLAKQATAAGISDDVDTRITASIEAYKQHTLPVVRYLDNAKKLIVVSGHGDGYNSTKTLYTTCGIIISQMLLAYIVG